MHYADSHPQLNLVPFIEFQKSLFQSFRAMEQAIKDHQFGPFVQLINRFFQHHADQSEMIPAVLLFLDELEGICSKITSSDWSNIQQLILDKLESTWISEKIFESDGVLIAPLSMMKSLFFDMVFLPHMNEGQFPKSNHRPFDLHPDEIKQMSSKSNLRFAQANDSRDEQSSWFESAKDHCIDALCISYSHYSLPKEDDLKSSPFLLGLKNEPIFIPEKTQTTARISPANQHVQKWIESNQSLCWDEFNAYLNPSFVTKTTYSSSQLSKYGTCPKQYFLSRILGLSVEDYLENEFQMMPKDKGIIVHGILIKFFSTLKQKNGIPLKKENRTKMQELLAEITHQTCSQTKKWGSYGITNLWNLDESEITTNLMEYVDREIQEASNWIPYSFEFRFGMKKFRDEEDDVRSTEFPLKLSLVNKELRFKGKVDRIDISPDQTRMRITDYKTGSLMERKSWGFDKGSQLQIPLYMLLADQFFPSLSLQEVIGKLVSIQAISKFDERNVTRSEILTKIDELYEHFEMINEGINSGQFFPNPGNNGENCTYCDFKGICGKSISLVVEKMDETPFMNRYQESKKALP